MRMNVTAPVLRPGSEQQNEEGKKSLRDETEHPCTKPPEKNRWGSSAMQLRTKSNEENEETSWGLHDAGWMKTMCGPQHDR